MKKFLLFLATVVFVIGFAGCSSKKAETINNLKKMADSENTATQRYKAYADQAAKDSLPNVQALFTALSKSENIHFNNAMKNLEADGVVDYKPQTGKIEVGTTTVNIQTSIQGETEEFSRVYPDFITTAQKESAEKEAVTFGFAQDVEMHHAKILAQTLSDLSNGKDGEAVYYICPKCGNVFPGSLPKYCNICGVPGDMFLKIESIGAKKSE